MRFELRGVDLQFRPASLEARSGLDHAILDRLDVVAIRQRAPRPNPVAFQDGVGIDEHGTAMTRHDASQLDGAAPWKPQRGR